MAYKIWDKEQELTIEGFYRTQEEAENDLDSAARIAGTARDSFEIITEKEAQTREWEQERKLRAALKGINL